MDFGERVTLVIGGLAMIFSGYVLCKSGIKVVGGGLGLVEIDERGD